jgi:signal transduction histidine kinase
MNELFEPFTQLERTLSLKRDGVGLGLAITKNLVELMRKDLGGEHTGPGHDLPLHDPGRDHAE